MLTKDLLEVSKRKPNIRPVYRDIDEYHPAAEQVIEAYQPDAGRTRGEIADAVAELETHDTFKLVRGLSKLLERQSTFEQQSPLPPERLRDAVFAHGFVTDTDERRQVLEKVATDHGLTPADVELGLWADRDDAEVLVSTPAIEPSELLRQYNLSLTQTLLFDAQELEFTASGNYQEIFGLVKYLRLMYQVDEEETVHVTGPASLLKQTRKYGTSMAKLVPSIMKADEWSVRAQIETEVNNETRIYEFSLDHSQDALFPEQTVVESFDSDVERDFATRIDSLADGWTVRREPTFLRTENRVMIPDFSFERDRNRNRDRDRVLESDRDDNDTAFYLEIVGFWTPEYLEKKLQKVRHVESAHPLMLAVNASLNCTTEDFDDAIVDQVFFYDDKIPVKPVLSRLQAIDTRHVAQDLQTLTPDTIEVPTEAVVDIGDLAEEHDVEPDAIRQLLDEHYPGTISNDRYVPEAVLETIKDGVEAFENPTLADVAPILEQYGVAQNVLEAVGYTIEFTSLDRADAEIRKTQR